MQQSTHGKFAVTVSASRAKRYVCNGNKSMRYFKKAAHKAQRRAWKYGTTFKQVTSWDII